MSILGRKKEMIVTPEGLNVFPEDVESVLKQQPGVRDAAVIGTGPRACGADSGPRSETPKKLCDAPTRAWPIISAFAAFPFGLTTNFPRTEGTGKLKRHEIAEGTPAARSHG